MVNLNCIEQSIGDTFLLREQFAFFKYAVCLMGLMQYF